VSTPIGSDTTKQELTGKYQEFANAVMTKDRAWLEENLAEDYGCFIVPTGALVNKTEYIANALTLVEASIEMGDVDVLERGDYATVQFTAVLYEKLADASSLNADVQAIREKMGIDDIVDDLGARSRNYYTGIWRRVPRGWECVLHTYVAPLVD
jgi:hypothetical protein